MIWCVLAIFAVAAWAAYPRPGELSQFDHRTSENKTNNVIRLPVGKQRVKRRGY